MTHDKTALTDASNEIAAAIERRDTEALAGWLAPGFVHHTPGGATLEGGAFLNGISQIPGDIAFVRVQQLEIDVDGDAALVSGIQHAQVRVDGQTVDDVRAFADFFVRLNGRWRLRAAVDLPAPAPAG
jgi:ketosteroid isomerase-like protein